MSKVNKLLSTASQLIYIKAQNAIYRYFMIAYDLETCLMKKGKKREDMLILSIGAVDILTGRTFHCYANPLSSAKKDFLKDLETYGVRMKPTETVLTNIHWRHDKAKALDAVLHSFESFLHDAKLLLPTPILIAHNGRSFDHKILIGSYRRLERSMPEFSFLDSWHDITKKGWPKQRCHKLQVLHQVCCPHSELSPRWHLALEDATALSEIVTATAVEEVAKRPRQAWSYACEQKDIFDHLNKAHHFKLSAERRLCKSSLRLWPEVVRRNGHRSKEFTLFCLEFCMKRVWQKLLR